MHLEICPTCLQDVDPNYKANVVNQLDSAIVQNIKQIKDLELEKKEVIEKERQINRQNFKKNDSLD